MNFNGIDKTVELFKVLASEPRIQIIKLLSKYESLSMNELSEKLGVTQGAVTAHIKVMLACGMVSVTEESGQRGTRKLVSLKEKKLIINLVEFEEYPSVCELNIGVGSYTSCSVKPPCAIATTTEVVGQAVDKTDGFFNPDRINAGILWLGSGFVEYKIPLPSSMKNNIKQIEITMEISSEAPGTCEDWPSDITFFINDVNVGTWVSPGDYGNAQGTFNPKWWDKNWNQFGLLKQLTINNSGSFMDDDLLSKHNISEILVDDENMIVLRIAVLEDSTNVGGLTRCGAGFGNYNQNILIRFYGTNNSELSNK